MFQSSFREIVSEDIDKGHIVLRLLASDPDQQNELDYSLVGPGSESFAMDRGTGILRVKADLDREVQDRFTLLGIAADRDGKVTFRTNDKHTVMTKKVASDD